MCWASVESLPWLALDAVPSCSFFFATPAPFFEKISHSAHFPFEQQMNSVATSRAPPPLDPEEPEKVSTAIAKWGLDYVVLTSVDRDDLEDQGSDHFRQVVQRLKEKKPDLLVEALTPDFQGNTELIHAVATSGLDVFAHNMETVERLTPMVRDRRAKYHQS